MDADRAARPPVVRARGVHRAYGATVALDGVSLDLDAGITGLLGPNGAGKTTLLGLVLGLHPPDAGHLEVLGLPVAAAGPQVRQRLGYAPEHDALPPDVRAQDLVRHVAELHGLARRDAIERASATLVLMGLGEERFRAIGTLSTGQRQRVKLAQAIAHDPDLVLLDEPTSGLDPLEREEMLTLIRRVGGDLGLDVIVSSHLLDEVERICDGVVVLREGHLSAVRELSERPQATELLLEVDDEADLAAVVERLAADGLWAARLAPTTAVVEGADDAAHDRIRDALADVGAGLRRLEPRVATLAELYGVADG